MPQYVVAQYGDKRRYLMKALREIAHRIESMVAGLDEYTLTARADDALGEEWCIKEIVGFLRDSEREDLRALEVMIERDGAPIAARQAQYGPVDHDYRSARVEELIWDFIMLREETVWNLRTAGAAWEHSGVDPYRGPIRLIERVQEMNERDLDAMWRIQRLIDHVQSPARGRR